MIPQSPDQIAALREFVGDWISLIAAGRYDDALRQIDEPNSVGHAVSASELAVAARKSLLTLPIHQFEKVIPKGLQATVDIAELVDGLAYAAHYHLPAMAGRFSLDIEFRFRERNGQYAVSIEDLR